MSWGGMAIWALQDVLADYISSTTALDLRKLESEVNILAFSYGKGHGNSAVMPLSCHALYSGTIRASHDPKARPCFQDIILASVCPPRSTLIDDSPLHRRISQGV